VRLYIAQSHLPFRSALSELLRTSLFRLFFAEPTLPILMMLMMMLLLMMMMLMMMMMMTMVMQPQTMLTPLSWNLCHHLNSNFNRAATIIMTKSRLLPPQSQNSLN